MGTDSSPVDSHSHNICSDLIDLFVDFGSLYGTQQAAHQIRQKQADGNANSQPSSKPAAPAPIRRAATNRVKMSNGLTLAHWEIDGKLSLLAMLRPDVIENQSALVEFNVDIFRQSIFQIQRVEAGEYDEAGEDD